MKHKPDFLRWGVVLATWLLMAGGHAFAAEIPCAVLFGSVTPGEPAPEELIVDTYNQFLETLGKGVSPTELAQVLEMTDPFRFPEGPDRTHGELNRKLQEFAAMLASRGWNSPAVRELLLDGLKHRLAGLGRAQTAIAVATEKNRRTVIPLEPYGTNAISPDGEWLVNAPNLDWRHEASGTVHNLTTGASRSFVYPLKAWANFHKQIRFSADGSQVYFAMDNGRILVVPFANGELGWKKARYQGKGIGSAGRGDDPFSQDGRFTVKLLQKTFGEDGKRLPLTLKRLKDHRVIQLDLPEAPPQGIDFAMSLAQAWEIVPLGESKLLVRQEFRPKDGTGPKQTIELFELEKHEGLFTTRWKAVRPRLLAEADFLRDGFSFLSDGSFVTYAGNAFLKWPNPKEPKQLLNLVATFGNPVKWKPGYETWSSPVMRGDEAFLLTAEAPSLLTDAAKKIYRVNLLTGQIVSVTEAPRDTETFQLTQDGKRILFEAKNRTVVGMVE